MRGVGCGSSTDELECPGYGQPSLPGLCLLCEGLGASLTPGVEKGQLRGSVNAGKCVATPEGGNGVERVSVTVRPLEGVSPACSGLGWESPERWPLVVHRLVTDVPHFESCRVGATCSLTCGREALVPCALVCSFRAWSSHV